MHLEGARELSKVCSWKDHYLIWNSSYYRQSLVSLAI